MKNLIITPTRVLDIISKSYYTHLRRFLDIIGKKVGLKERLFLTHFDIGVGAVIATTKNDHSISKNLNLELNNSEYELVKKEINDDPKNLEFAMLAIIDDKNEPQSIFRLIPKDYSVTLLKGKKTVLFTYFDVANEGSRGGVESFIIFLITEKPESKKMKKVEKAAELIKGLLLNFTIGPK